MKRRVYITNKGCHDYEGAKRFGELIFLSDGIINPCSVGRMYREFFTILKHSRSCDYLLPTGLTISNMVASAIFSQLHGRLNLLIYSTTKRTRQPCYKERVVNLDL
jgi:hypothetical protein